jgi:hypothetical protein
VVLFSKQEYDYDLRAVLEFRRLEIHRAWNEIDVVGSDRGVLHLDRECSVVRYPPPWIARQTGVSEVLAMIGSEQGKW